MAMSGVPGTGQNLQPFTGNGDVSIWVKNSPVGRKNPNKQSSVIVDLSFLQWAWWYPDMSPSYTLATWHGLWCTLDPKCFLRLVESLILGWPLRPVGLLLNFFIVLSLFHYYLPFGKAVSFIWTNLNPRPPRMLCHFGWNWFMCSGGKVF